MLGARGSGLSAVNISLALQGTDLEIRASGVREIRASGGHGSGDPRQRGEEDPRQRGEGDPRQRGEGDPRQRVPFYIPLIRFSIPLLDPAPSLDLPTGQIINARPSLQRGIRGIVTRALWGSGRS